MILSIGHVAFDLIANMEELPRQNTSRPVSRYKECFGGGGGNFAVAVRTLGEPASLFSVVGSDFRSSAYEKKLAALGIGCCLVPVSGPTAHCWMFFSGNDYQSYFAGSFDAMRRERVPEKLADAHVAHFTAGQPDFVLRNMQRLRKLNPEISLSLDPSYDIHFYNRKEMLKCLELADYFFCNMHELKDLKDKTGITKRDVLELAEVLKVTEGADGCTVYTKELPQGLHAPAKKVRISNTVGAGDAHSAGFLVAQQRGLDLKRSAQVANYVASRVVQQMGAQDGLPAWRALPKNHR